MIRIDQASVSYRGRPALHTASLAVEPGAFTVVVGPNGAGKSTLLKLLAGELTPDEGRVLIDDRPLPSIAPRELARRRAVLPQSSALAFPFTVAEVVRLGLDAGGRPSRAQDIVEALERVDLAGFSGRYYQEISGGEQQRVHLARVLCQIGAPVADDIPRYLFLDEPISSLDIRHQLAVLGIGREFARSGGGVVAVLHDLNLAAGFADRLVVVSQGTIAADGPPAAILTDALIERVFRLPLRVGTLPPPGIPFVLPQTAA